MEIAEIEKNSAERIRVELTEYGGHDLIGLRVFFKKKLTENEWGPTRKGITCRVELLPEIIAALKKAEAEARKQGTLQ